MLGITFGFGSMVLATGLGLAGVVHAEPRLHAVLKYAGAAYLLYLAWRIARADAASASARARPIGFVEATLFTWMNPKAWVSALGAAAAFTTVGGDMLWQSAVIAGVLAAFCLLSVAIWAGFGTVIGRYLADPRARRRLQPCRWPACSRCPLIPVFGDAHSGSAAPCLTVRSAKELLIWAMPAILVKSMTKRS